MRALPRLIATDLDGTLLRSDDTLSERTCAAIRLAQSRGVEVVLVTARPPRSVRWIGERLGVSGRAVCGNGSMVYDLAARAIVHSAWLPTALALELAARLRAEADGFTFAVEHGHRIGFEPGYPQNPGYIHDHAPRVASLEDLCAEDVTKLLVHHPERPPHELAASLARHLGDRATVTHSGAPYVEVCAAGVSKASALAHLCNELACPPAQVLAFGDMPNDLPMLAFAGHGVAVANAHPDVLAVADEVTASNDDDGVAQVIERLLR